MIRKPKLVKYYSHSGADEWPDRHISVTVLDSVPCVRPEWGMNSNYFLGRTEVPIHSRTRAGALEIMSII